MPDLTTIEKASRLLYHGISQTSPHRNSECRMLLQEYTKNAEFQGIVESIAEGMNLKILNVDSNLGILVCPMENSNFTYSLSDDRRNLAKDLKSVWGLILLSIASYLFPKIESFNEIASDEVMSIEPVKLDDYIRSLCKITIEKEGERKDPEVESPDVETMYSRYLSHISVDGDSERSRSTTISAIKNVFRFLEEKKLVRARDDGTYAILPNFKFLMRELSTNQHLKEFLKNTSE